MKTAISIIVMLVLTAPSGAMDENATDRTGVETCPANHTVRNVGGVELAIAYPAGFIDACSRDVDLYRSFSVTGPNSDFLACFLTESDWEMYMAGGGRIFSPHLSVDTFSRKDYGVGPSVEFSVLAQHVREALEEPQIEISELEREITTEVTKIQSEFLNRKIEAEVEYQLPLGVFADHPKRISATILSSVNAAVDERPLKYLDLSTHTYLVIHGRILSLEVHQLYEGEDDVPAIQEFTSDWVNLLVACNEP